MFKKFIERLLEARTEQEAVDNVFYGTVWDADGKIKEYGIDMAFQHDKISAKEFELLSALIDKIWGV